MAVPTCCGECARYYGSAGSTVNREKVRHRRFLVVIVGLKMCLEQACTFETVNFITVQSKWEGICRIVRFSTATRNQNFAPWSN